MSDTTIESIVWVIGLFLFGTAAAAPEQLIRTLGRGHVSASLGVLWFFRIVAAVCFVGAIYRLFAIQQR